MRPLHISVSLEHNSLLDKKKSKSGVSSQKTDIDECDLSDKKMMVKSLSSLYSS